MIHVYREDSVRDTFTVLISKPVPASFLGLFNYRRNQEKYVEDVDADAARKMLINFLAETQ
jgi:hypothetical protein